MSSTRRRPARARRNRPERIVVVIPSDRLRREIVARLAALGHTARIAESFDQALALVKAGVIDTLVLHVSAFSTNLLVELGRATTRRRAIALVASVSVFSTEGADGGRGFEQDRAPSAPGKESPWQVATYWLPFVRLSEFSASLRGTNLN